MFVLVHFVVVLGSLNTREGGSAAKWPKNTVTEIRCGGEAKFFQVRKLGQDCQDVLWVFRQ